MKNSTYINGNKVNDEIDFYIKFVRYNSYPTYIYGDKNDS